MTRVLITGYYGRANFGDDILMLVTYRLLRAAIPDAAIAVLVDGTQAGYVAQLLPQATLLSPGYHGHFDLIVHGGGGVFFDFASYGPLSRLLEKAWHILGYRRYLHLEGAARALLGRPRTSATRRLGIGIGVGSFSAGSPRLREKLHALTGFNALWVRDNESIENLKRFTPLMKAEIIAGSDLAFLHEYWKPDALPGIQCPPNDGRPRLGIALRDWRSSTPETLAALLATLAQNYTLTGFILDAQSDPQMRAVLAPYPHRIWNPNSGDIETFVTALAQQDVVLTSRAHGAICAACLGVPSVIVPIEPKLVQVHAMLSHASILCRLESTVALQEAIGKASTIDRQAVAADIAHNRDASQAALHHIARWFA